MKKVIIIADLGINHNGNIEIAKKLIKGAKDSGVDLVKLQKRSINKVYTKEELDKLRESPWGLTNREQKEGLEFNEEEYDEINDYCKKVGIEWFASVWDLESANFLRRYGLKYNKIPSPRLGHIELLNKIASEGKKTFISTGMSTLQEIENAVRIFKEYNCPFELMHCNSTYPCPDEDLNLLLIPYLKKYFNCEVGYSGHSPGIMDGIIASVLGATSIEKHITTSRVIYGSDQPSSLEIHGFSKMVEYIRYGEMSLGSGHKIISEEEWKVRSKLWRTKDCEI